METVDLNIKDLRHMLLTISKLRGSDQKKNFFDLLYSTVLLFCVNRRLGFVINIHLD